MDLSLQGVIKVSKVGTREEGAQQLPAGRACLHLLCQITSPSLGPHSGFPLQAFHHGPGSHARVDPPCDCCDCRVVHTFRHLGDGLEYFVKEFSRVDVDRIA